MRIEVGDRTFEGRAVDLAGAADPAAVVAAIRGETPADVAVECPDPGPVHDHVGHVHGDMTFDSRAALAAAARSRGETAPQREELDAVRAELASLSTPDVDPDGIRRRVAETGASEERLRERVATLRGRVRALEESGDAGGGDAARGELRDAIRELTEAETERIAAEQLFDRLERERRDVRDVRDRRLELQDRAANLERAAREHLADAMADRFRDAVAALPGGGAPGDGPDGYRDDPVTAALATARIANVDAPLVVEPDRLGGAASAARRLDAAVVSVNQ